MVIIANLPPVTVLVDVPETLSPVARQLPIFSPGLLPETVYIRTTPGRLLLNHLIYENLFL